MTLPVAPAQLSHSLIMAEWSHPANTEWKISADGAGYINFTVGSIIKESDFYGKSAQNAYSDMVAVSPWRGISQSRDGGVTFSAMTKENFGPGTTLGFSPGSITQSADGLYRTHLFPQTIAAIPSTLSSTGYYYFCNTSPILNNSCWAYSETGGHSGDDWVAVTTNDASDGSRSTGALTPNPGTSGHITHATASNLNGHNGQACISFATGMRAGINGTGAGAPSYHPLTSMDGPYRLQDMEAQRTSGSTAADPNAIMQGAGASTGMIYWTGSAWTCTFSQGEIATGHGGSGSPSGANGGNWLTNQQAGMHHLSTSRSSFATAAVSKCAKKVLSFTPQGSSIHAGKIYWDPAGNYGIEPGNTVAYTRPLNGSHNLDQSPGTFTGATSAADGGTWTYAGGYSGNHGENFIIGNPNYANPWLIVMGGRLLLQQAGQDPNFGGASGGAYINDLMIPGNVYQSSGYPTDVNGNSAYWNTTPEGLYRITGATRGGDNFGDTVLLGTDNGAVCIFRASGNHTAGNWTRIALGSGFGSGRGATGRLWWCDHTSAFYGVMNSGQLFRSTNLTTWTLCLDPGASSWSTAAGYTPSQPQGNAGVEDLASPGIYNFHD